MAAISCCLAFLWLLLLPESFAQNCSQAESCLQGYQLTNTSCLDDLEQLFNVKVCVQKNVLDCDSEQSHSLQEQLDDTVSQFTAVCSSVEDGCNNLVNRYEKFKNCTPADTNFESLLDTAVGNWNIRNQRNVKVDEQIKSLVRCIETNVTGCGVLREAYGRLYKTYPRLPLIQQELNIFKDTGGPDPASPIMQDCDGNVDDVLKEILTKCRLEMKTNETRIQIINYCVPLQEQIDCALAYQNTCPVAVTKFLRPFMDSYGVTHSIFCNNITMHGLQLRSLNPDCGTETYKSRYMQCWHPIMKEFAITQNLDLDPNSMDVFFRMPSFFSDKICRILRDQARYNTTKMRECTNSMDQLCPMLFPTHGSPIPIPEGLRYDPDLYTLLSAGVTPFNEYGVVLLQYTRDHFCYPACVNYSKLNEDYSTNCKDKLVTEAKKVSSSSTTACSSLSEMASCASNITNTCPLFQYQTTKLFDDEVMTTAMNICNISRPNLLPDSYFVHTTQASLPSTTRYWTEGQEDINSPTNSSTLATEDADETSKAAKLRSSLHLMFVLTSAVVIMLLRLLV